MKRHMEPERISRRDFARLALAASASLFAPFPPVLGKGSGSVEAAPPPRAVFFPSANDGRKGFFVSDDDEAQFLTAFERLGKVDILGYPVGRRYSTNGLLFQPFQRMVLVWDPRSSQAAPAPLLDILHEKGLDAVLRDRFGIPRPSTKRTAAILLPPLIKAFYEKYGAQAVFGAPASEPEGTTPFSVQRFQNVVLQVWNTDVEAMPPKGTVVLVPVGQHAKDLGLYPQEALAPEAAPEAEPAGYGEQKNLAKPQVEKYVAPQIVRRGDPGRPLIYLTIDDCNSITLVERALDIAAEHQLSLTFFPIGNILGRAPELWQRAVAEGHDIENHTQTHSRLSSLSSERIAWEIQTAHAALQEALGQEYQQRSLRPPGGDGVFNYDPRLPAICQQLGYKIAMWTIDSSGYRGISVASVVHNVGRDLSSGSIVLQHAVSSDIGALPGIIDSARQLELIPIAMSAGMV